MQRSKKWWQKVEGRYRRSSIASIVNPLLYPRRFQAYGVGAPRSGTLSLAHIFSNYRAEHEAESARTINELCDYTLNKRSRSAILSYLADRDRRLRLEMESSHFLVYGLGELVELFPEAKFIMTLRDCFSWLESTINRTLQLRKHNQHMQHWERLAKLRYDNGVPHPPEEKALADLNLYTLDAYFSNWAWHYQKVLDTVPADRLLIVPTKELSQRMPVIAAFLEIPTDTLQAERSHSHQGKDEFQLLDYFDQSYLEAKIDQNCHSLMQQYFPDFTVKRKR